MKPYQLTCPQWLELGTASTFSTVFLAGCGGSDTDISFVMQCALLELPQAAT